MLMKGSFKLVEPEKMDAQLTVTMSLAEWKALRGQLSEKYPSWKFGRFIDEIIAKAENQFSADSREMQL